MNKEQRRLRIAQLDKKIAHFSHLKNTPAPGRGWIHAIRTALGMSLKQLGNKLDMTPQGVRDIERREEEGALTLQRFREVATAMDMQFVYGLIPKEHSLEKMIEKRAFDMAKDIVLTTSHTMHLEDQGVDKKALEDAIQERAKKIKSNLPKKLWD